jgi:hypothetical protein
MTKRPIGADDVTGELPSVVEDRINNWIDGAVSPVAGGLSDHLSDPTDAHDASSISLGAISGVTATDMQAFAAEVMADIANLALPYTKAEDWGALGDGATNDTAAIQVGIDFLTALGGGIIMFTAGKMYRAGGLVNKAGVILMGPLGDQWSQVTKGKPHVKTPSGWAGGWVIDSASSCTGAGVIGLKVDGGMTSTASPDTGGIRVKGGSYGSVLGNLVQGTSLNSIKVDGTAWKVGHNQCGNYFGWRDTYPLVAHEGIIQIEGTDHFVFHNVANALLAFDDASVPSSGVIEDIKEWGMLIDTLTSWIFGGSAEFCKGAWNIRMYAGYVFGARADTNPGPGLYTRPSLFNGTSGGVLYHGLRMIGNCGSPNAASKYAHITVASYGDRFEDTLFAAPWILHTNTPAYGIVELTSYNTNLMQREAGMNTFRGLQSVHSAHAPAWTNQEVWTGTSYGRVNHKEPRTPFARRPHASLASARTTYDPNLTCGCISDGRYWRRSSDGKRMGSFLTLEDSEAAAGNVSHWLGYASTATIDLVYDQMYYLGRVFQATCTATGVTNAFAGAVTNGVGITDCPAPPVGSTVRATCYAKGPAGKASTGDAVIIWYTAAFAVISTSPSSPIALTNGASDAPVKVVGSTHTVPATAAYMAFLFVGRATGLANGDKFTYAYADFEVMTMT